MKLPLRGDGIWPRAIKSKTIAFLLFSGFAAACGHNTYSAIGTTTTTSAAQPSTPVTPGIPEAIAAISGTRCMREAKCDNVGAGRRYPSYSSCVSEFRGQALSHLTSYTCPNGTVAAQLDGCLADIRGRGCSNELDTIDHVTACSTSSLCPR
jgi:Family of unknown function (DUF6184)